MIDYFAIGLTHGLLALAVWRLLLRDDLDQDEGGFSAKRPRPWLKGHKATEKDTGDA